jgi:NAD+ diphosphatase
MTTKIATWRLTYTGVRVDRAGELRIDAAKLSAFLESDEAHFVPVWNTQHLFDVRSGEAIIVSHKDLEASTSQIADPIFLGIAEDKPIFAVSIPGDEEPDFLRGLGSFDQLHPRVGGLHADQAALLAYARGMLLWQANHAFCGRCGAPTQADQGGHVRQCASELCGWRSFPRTDAAVITLVEHPDGNRCLLGRQSKWPPGMYSVVAGFVEPGESLEECVIREVREETGVEVRDATYIASQPWPFPSSLMLGFTARAITTDFKPADDELDDIQWVARADLDRYGEMGDQSEGPKLPNRHSIARMLIERWRSQG